MEDTQDIRGKRSCRDATNNYLTRWSGNTSTNNQPSCNAIHEQCPTIKVELEWLSYKERRVDALALRADERRDKLR